jgi:hypothetical protein
MITQHGNKIYRSIVFLFIISALVLGATPVQATGRLESDSNPANPTSAAGSRRIYLPVLQNNPAPIPGAVRVNAPYFVGDVRFSETTAFWFGQVTPDSNYADVRIGYNDTYLYLNVNIFDRRLWYDTQPSASSLTNYDAISLSVNLDGKTGSSVGSHAFRFVGGAYPSGGSHNNDPKYKAAYQGNGSGWAPSPAAFTAYIGWRGDTGFNVPYDQKGWVITYNIPYSSLGLSRKPDNGSIWGIGLVLYNRNGSSSPVTTKSWPDGMNPSAPSTWAQLYFGTPAYAAPSIPAGNTVVIREGLNGAHVVDGEVGGGTTCAEGLDFWTQWGTQPQPGSPNNTDFNIQNQSDVADWPCYAKYYISFPLDQVPAGKVILSARLTLHEMGSSGGTDWNPPPESSYIQVYKIGQGWDENTLTWNNAPPALENVSGAWVDPTQFPGWPGIPYVWDVSRVAADAYSHGQPLRLAMYSADSAYHSGKYFVSSHTGDWNAVARPTLEITWGTP